MVTKRLIAPWASAFAATLYPVEDSSIVANAPLKKRSVWLVAFVASSHNLYFSGALVLISLITAIACLIDWCLEKKVIDGICFFGWLAIHSIWILIFLRDLN